MKEYYVRKEEYTKDIVVEEHDTTNNDCNKEVYRSKKEPKWLNKLDEGVNLFYVEYNEKGNTYVL